MFAGLRSVSVDDISPSTGRALLSVFCFAKCSTLPSEQTSAYAEIVSLGQRLLETIEPYWTDAACFDRRVSVNNLQGFAPRIEFRCHHAQAASLIPPFTPHEFSVALRN